MSTLAPAIAQMFPGVAGAGWAEVCTTLGAKLIAVDDASRSAPAGPAPVDQMLKHCPYCALHITALGMPPAPLSIPPAPPGNDEVPALFLSAPHTLFAWSAAQPRAPPRRS